MRYELFTEIKDINSLCDQIVYYTRTGNYYERSRLDRRLLTCLMSLEDFNEAEEFLSILKNLLEAYENKDFVLYADYIELQLSVFLNRMLAIYMEEQPLEASEMLYEKNMKVFANIDPQIASRLENLPTPDFQNGNYIAEYTSSGYLTMYCKGNGSGRYLHSNIKPRLEGMHWANDRLGLACQEYSIYGLGLGYHIQELAEKSKFAKIIVFENDIEMLKAAAYYIDYSFLLVDRISLKLNDKSIPKRLVYDDDKRFLIYGPSLSAIQQPELTRALELFMVEYQSIRGRSQWLYHNFNLNMYNYTYVIDELQNSFKDKNVYVIAAGPSLDESISYLKKVGKEDIILATGAVLKRLLKEDIVPDYCIITDPGEIVYRQIDGIEELKIPLLGMSTVYSEIFSKFMFDKYIIFQSGFSPAEQYAKENGYMLFETGGSVATTALGICTKFECKTVICVGLDLAYPNNQDHASGAATRENIHSQDLIEVDCNDGTKVLTSRTLDVYRTWVEKHILRNQHVSFYNVSKSGAKIKGMKLIAFEDLF